MPDTIQNQVSPTPDTDFLTTIPATGPSLGITGNNDYENTALAQNPNFSAPSASSETSLSFDGSRGNTPKVDWITALENNAESLTLRKTPKGLNTSALQPSITPYEQTEKYLDMPYGYRAGVDLDDIYGNQEGFFKSLGKGGVRLGEGIVSKTGQGVGFLGTLLNPYNWDSNIITTAADNGFSKFFDQLDKETKQGWGAVFQEANDRDKGFWARAATDGDFWMDDVVDGVAFMASAWIPGMALSKLGLGVKIATGLSGLRLGAQGAEAIVEGTAMAENYLTKAAKIAPMIDKFNAWALATGSEAMFESVGVKDTILKSLDTDETGRVRINPKTNQIYTEKEKREIAAGAAQNTFLLNSALLSVTNALELKWIGNVFGKAEGKALGNALTGTASLTEPLALKAATSGFDKFLNGKAFGFLKGAGEGIVAEGYLEENGQLAIQRVNEKYGSQGKIANIFNFNEVLGQYGEQTLAATLGEDPEAASSIGIGGLLGLLGGRSAMKQVSKDKLTTEQAISSYNSAQQNWLKFGNVYKTTTQNIVNEDGTTKEIEKLQLDKDNNPIVDQEKLKGIVSSYQGVTFALDEASKTDNRFKRDYLRDMAFGKFVEAHIEAGLETELMTKLDDVKKYTPVDLSKLGFLLDENSDKQLNKYKALAADIIKQNKLLNQDVIFNDSEVSKARKGYLTNLATEQAVYKNILNEVVSDSDLIKSQISNTETSSLSDGFVDQANALQQRINSQKEVIDILEKEGTKPTILSNANNVLNELTTQQKDLVKFNKETIATLEKDEKTGMYKHEKVQRADGLVDKYNKKIKHKGELMNEIRNSAFMWSKIVDAQNGTENFLNIFNEQIVDPVNQKLAEQAKAATVVTPASKKFVVKFTKEDATEDSFEFEIGKTYKQKAEPGVETDYFTVADISKDGKTITMSQGEDGNIEVEAAAIAKIAKENNWEEFRRPKQKAPFNYAGQHPKELESDIHIEGDPKSSTYTTSDKAPKFEEVGFNKTFGRHYIDDKDTKLNTEEGTDRFFNFTAKFAVDPVNYTLEVVTEHNDKFGIRQSDYNVNDIKVIVLKKTINKNGSISFNYIDQNNNIIADEKANKDNIVYRSFPDISKYNPENVREKYTVDAKTTDAQILDQIKKFTDYQTDLISRSEKAVVYLDPITNSPGIQRVETTSSIDEDGKRIIAKAELEGRLIQANPDWSQLVSANNPNNFIGLRVNTANGAIAPGLLAGRAVMQEYTYDLNNKKVWVNSKTSRVFNRLLDDSEKETVITALSRFSELFGKTGKNKNEVRTPSEDSEYNIILDYLKNVLNWGVPKAGIDSKNYFWVSQGLHAGGITYAFDKATIAANKDNILKNAYHHINNRTLQKNQSFQTIKFVNGKAVPAISYITYEQYLLDKRKEGVPPVYTSLPLVDSKNPQRTNVFLTWRDPAAQDLVPIGKIERTPKVNNPGSNRNEFKKATSPVKNLKDLGAQTLENAKKLTAKPQEPIAVVIPTTDESGKVNPLKALAAKTMAAAIQAEANKTKAVVPAPVVKKVIKPAEDLIRELIGGKMITEFTPEEREAINTVPIKRREEIRLEMSNPVVSGTEADLEKRNKETNVKYLDLDTQLDAIYNKEIIDRDNLINKLIQDIPLPKNARINNWSLEELNGKEWEAIGVRGKEEEYFGKENWDKIKEAKKEFDVQFKKIEDSNLVKINLIEQKQSDLLSTINGLELRKAWSFGLIEESTILGLDETNYIDKETEYKNDELVEKDTYIGYYYLPNIDVENKERERVEDITGKTIEEVKNKINAKYAAELFKATLNASASISTARNSYFDLESATANAYPDLLAPGMIRADLSEKNINGEVRVAYTASIKDTGNTAANISQLRKKLLEELENDAPFRLATENFTKTEDFKKFAKFLDKALPQIETYKMAELIYGKAFGMFKNGGIYIYKNAEIGTGFHEAFEAVWNSYLTKDEQNILAAEFRNRKGDFTNTFSKETKPYSEASMYDVREMLAEDFRTYILDSQAPLAVAGEKAKTFFEKVWNFIQRLFGASPKVQEELNNEVNKLFKKIKSGGYRNASPISEKNLVAEPVFRIGKLSQVQSTGVLEGLNHYFFSDLFSNGGNINTILKNLTKEDSNALFSELLNNSYSKVIDNLKLFPSIKANVEVYKNDVVAHFKENLKRYGLVFKELDIDETEVTDTLGIKDSMSVDPRKSTGADIKLLLASTAVLKYNAKNELAYSKNDMNQPRLIDADRVHNVLLNELANIVPIYNAKGEKKNVLDQMFNKLDKKYKREDGTYRNDYTWIKSLKIRLKIEDKNGNPIDINAITADDMQLRMSFTKSFSNTKTIPQKTIVGDEGYIYSTKPLISVNLDRIREEWSNNLKIQIQDKKNNLVKIDPSGNMIINRDSDLYNRVTSLLNNPSQIDIFQSQAALNLLGIKFNADTDELLPYENMLRENLIQILNLFKNGTLSNINDLYGNNIIGGRINELLNLQGVFNGEDNILSYLNAEGQAQYSVSIPSLWSNIINTINSVASLEELVNTNPWMGKIGDDGKALLYPYQSSSELLKRGGKLFDNNGKRRRGADLNYHVISGVGDSESSGTSTSDLQFPDRIANEIHYLIPQTEGKKQFHIAFSIINSDKSTEYGIEIPGDLLVGYNQVRNFLAEEVDESSEDEEIGATMFNAVKNQPVLDKYVNQLSDELYAAVIQKNDPNNIQYYKDGVFNLGHFRDIISANIKDKFNEEVLGDEPVYEGETAHIDFIKDNISDIEGDIYKYIIDETAKTVQFLQDLDIFTLPAKQGNNLFITNAIDNDTLNDLLKVKDKQTVKYRPEGSLELVERSGYTAEEVSSFAALLLINKELLAGEQHKLIYGHPALYKDLPKRANGATSTKESTVEDTDVIQWMDTKMVRNDGKVRTDSKHQTTKVISFKDQNVVSLFHQDIAEGIYADHIKAGLTKNQAEAKVGAKFTEDGALQGYILDKKGEHTGDMAPYLSLNEADAMAWGMPDAIRDLLFTSNKLDDKQQSQWDYEIAYEKLVRSGRIAGFDGKFKKASDPSFKRYGKEELKAALKDYTNGDQGYIFPVLKPQYFGYAVNDSMMHPVFLKHAVQPKFFRHVEGSQYEGLYVASQRNQVDIIGFESGEKVGNVTDDNGDFTSIYNDKGGVNIQIGKNGYELPAGLPEQDLYSKFYGIQVEQAAKAKNSVVRGSQITKLIMVNFYENGKPINEKVGNIIKDYNETLRDIIKLGKESLIKDLGLKKAGDNAYAVSNLGRLVQLLRNEAKQRDMPDNIINAINAKTLSNNEQSLQYPFDTLINREKIENILNSLVDSNVISEKMPGKSSPQVASTLYESNPRDFMYLKDGIYKTLEKGEKLTNKEKESVKMQSSDLKFYRNENGKITKMEVYITWPFKGISPEDLGMKLENGIYKTDGIKGIAKELLNAIAFRIPTQSPNSIENMIIKGFTPISNGDMIVVPSEIVGKSGSDFDIDKLNIYLANHYIDVVNKTKDFNSKSFKDFIRKDFITRGYTAEKADKLISSLSKEQFDKINRSAPTDEMKAKYNVEFSVSDISADDENFDTISFIKKGLINYTSSLKGQTDKVIRYEQPGTDSKVALQNKLINIISELISQPENYGQLVTPNSTATLKTLATEVRKLKVEAGTKQLEDEKSPTYLRSFIGAAKTRERYLTAKRMVGIAALHSTFHSLAQVSGITVAENYKTSGIGYLSNAIEKQIDARGKSKNVIVKQTSKPINIKLEHFDKNENGNYSIGYKNNIDGEAISDLNSQAVSGFVDGAKDPFVFDLNFSLNTASTWFYLQHMGVGSKSLGYFFNQPILDKYFNEQAKNKSSFKKANQDIYTREELFHAVIAPYYDRVFGGDLIKDLKIYDTNPFLAREFKAQVLQNINNINNGFNKFSKPVLLNAIKDGESAEPKLQMAVLLNYLEYEAQSRLLSNFMQAVNYDTNKTRTIQENVLQVAKWKRAESDGFINNPEAILDNTFIGEMKKQKEDVFNLFRNFFISLSPEVQEVFEPMYDKINSPDFFASKADSIALLNRYQNFVLSYLLHTTEYLNQNDKIESLNQLYAEMFTGDETLAHTLQNLKENIDPNISDNLIVKELLPLLTDDANKTSNIRLFRNRMDTFQINNVIESLENLKEYALNTSDTKLIKFVNDIAKFSILQSGFQASNIDFKKVLSIESYSDLVSEILTRFKDNPEISAEQVWKSFNKNNWSNRQVVPKAPSWLKIKDGQILVNPTSAVAQNDYMVKYVRIAGVSNNRIAELKKEKKLNEAFQAILFENTKLYDDKTNKIVFIPVNKLGNGNKLTEIYKDDRQSVLTKNEANYQSKFEEAGWKKASDLFPESFFSSMDTDQMNDVLATVPKPVITSDITYGPEGLPKIDRNNNDNCSA